MRRGEEGCVTGRAPSEGDGLAAPAADAGAAPTADLAADLAADPEGVTLVEFVVAALLVVVATTMVGSIAGPLDSLRRSAPNDVDVAVLDAAADIVARTLRSVRPSTWHQGVAGSPTALELQVGPADDPAWVVLRFVGDALTIDHLGPGDVSSRIPVGTVLAELDEEASRFVLRDSSGADVTPGDQGLATIGVVLVREDVEVVRLEDLRVVRGAW